MPSKQVESTLIHEVDTAEKFETSLKSDYFEGKDPGFDFILERIPSNVKTICDIGCGTGLVGLYIKSKLGDNVQLTFLDCHPELLKKIPTECGIKVLKDLLEYEPKEKFDCVVSRLVHHYFPKESQQQVFDKVYEILKEGGTYVAAIPLEVDIETQKAINDFWYVIRCWTAEKKQKSKENLVKEYILTINELVKIVENIGFSRFNTLRINNYNIMHSIDSLSGRFELKKHEVKYLEEFMLLQPKIVQENLSVVKKDRDIYISQPMYIVKAIK